MDKKEAKEQEASKEIGHLSSSEAKELEASTDYLSPNLVKAASRWITVEPVIMLVAVAIGIYVVIQPQYLRERVADSKNVTLPPTNGDQSQCVARNRSNPYYIALQEIQGEVSFWQMVITVSGTLPALITSPFLGAWGDQVGRKVILGLAVFGYFILFLTYLFVYYFVLPLWVFPIGFLLQGLTGGTGLIIAGSVAYVTDATQEKNRIHRIGIVHGSFLIGIGLTQVAVGYIVQEVGYGPAIWITGATVSLSLFYVILPPFLIETVDTRKTHDKSSSALDHTSSLQSLINLFKINTEHRRLRLAILFTVEILNETLNASAVGVIIIYGLGPPFCWSSVLVAGYWTMLLFLTALGMIIATKTLSLFLADFWVLQISNCFAIFNGFMTAFANKTVGLYVAAALGSLRGMSQPMIPLILSKIVTKKEHGVVFAFEASVLNLGTLISPVILNNIYSATVQTQPNFVFIMVAVGCIIPLVLTGALQVITARSQNNTTSSSDGGGIHNEGFDEKTDNNNKNTVL